MKYILTGAVLLLSIGAAQAGEAHVCRSETQKVQKFIGLSDNTTFTCGENVKGNIPQLANQGWKIVQVTQQVESLGASPTSYYELVVQKP